MADTNLTPDLSTAGSVSDARAEAGPASSASGVEGVIYLTPDGDGYILYASASPTTALATAC